MDKDVNEVLNKIVSKVESAADKVSADIDSEKLGLVEENKNRKKELTDKLREQADENIKKEAARIEADTDAKINDFKEQTQKTIDELSSAYEKEHESRAQKVAQEIIRERK